MLSANNNEIKNDNDERMHTEDNNLVNNSLRVSSSSSPNSMNSLNCTTTPNARVSNNQLATPLSSLREVADTLVQHPNSAADISRLKRQIKTLTEDLVGHQRDHQSIHDAFSRNLNDEVLRARLNSSAELVGHTVRSVELAQKTLRQVLDLDALTDDVDSNQTKKDNRRVHFDPAAVHNHNVTMDRTVKEVVNLLDKHPYFREFSSDVKENPFVMIYEYIIELDRYAKSKCPTFGGFYSMTQANVVAIMRGRFSARVTEMDALEQAPNERNIRDFLKKIADRLKVAYNQCNLGFDFLVSRIKRLSVRSLTALLLFIQKVEDIVLAFGFEPIQFPRLVPTVWVQIAKPIQAVIAQKQSFMRQTNFPIGETGDILSMNWEHFSQLLRETAVQQHDIVINCPPKWISIVEDLSSFEDKESSKKRKDRDTDDSSSDDENPKKESKKSSSKRQAKGKSHDANNKNKRHFCKFCKGNRRHTTEQCNNNPVNKPSGEESKASSDTKAKDGSANKKVFDKTKIVCHHCNEVGHIKPKCPKVINTFDLDMDCFDVAPSPVDEEEFFDELRADPLGNTVRKTEIHQMNRYVRAHKELLSEMENEDFNNAALDSFLTEVQQLHNDSYRNSIHFCAAKQGQEGERKVNPVNSSLDASIIGGESNFELQNLSFCDKTSTILQVHAADEGVTSLTQGLHCFRMRKTCKNCTIVRTSSFVDQGISELFSHTCVSCNSNIYPLHLMASRSKIKNFESQSSTKFLSSKIDNKLSLDYESKMFTNPKDLENSALKELLLPIEIEGKHRELAFFDTGSDFSAISLQLALELGLKLVPFDGIIKGFNPNLVQKLLHVTYVTVSYGKFTVKHRFDVCAGLSHNVYIGRDLMSPFGIKIVGLEHNFPKNTITGLPDRKSQQMDECIRNETDEYNFLTESFDMDIDSSGYNRAFWNPAQKLPEHLSNKLAAAIARAQERNRSIPLGTFCSDPLALITLDIKSEAVPQYRKQYKVDESTHLAISKQVEEWLKHGIIKLGDFGNRWNSAILGVSKKDPVTGQRTQIRVCIDYRPTNAVLNEPVIDNIPLVADLFQRVAGKKYFSALDMKWSFHQMPVSANDQEKTGFEWSGRRYVFRGAPFGIKTLTSRMQELASKVLQEDYDHVLIYVDDIIIMSDTLDEHIAHINSVIDKLTAVNLRLNFDKCHFGFSSIQILGHLLTGDSRRPDPEKLRKLMSWVRPTTGKQIMSFLGFVNYLRDYVPNMSQLAAPLDKLRNIKILSEADWTPACAESFEALKTILANPPIIRPYKAGLELHVACDASQLGVGAVLYQIDPTIESSDHRRYICFASRALNSGQRNYSATRRELLAIIFALQRFRFWLVDKHFILETDHRALIFMLHHDHTNYMINSWLDVLIDFDFTVVHCPGILNVLPDHLSRQYAEFSELMMAHNQHQRVLIEEGVGLHKQSTDISSQTIHQSARRQRRKVKKMKFSLDIDTVNDKPTIDTIFTDILKKGSNKPIKPLYLNEKISCPDKEMQEFILERLNKIAPEHNQRHQMLLDSHDNCGHRGAEFMFKHLWNDGYYWPGMKKACLEIVAVCLPCLRWNIGKTGFHPMKGIISDGPFRHIAIDLADYTHLRQKEGYRYILVIVDLFTKFVILKPLKEKTGLAVARELFHVGNFVGHFKILQSDNGSEFDNQILREYHRLMKSEHRFISPYHPNANGVAENTVKQVKSILNKWLEGQVTEWTEQLSTVQYAINCNVTSLTDSAPFSILFGRAVDPIVAGPLDIDKPDEPSPKSQFETNENFLERSRMMVELLFPSIAEKIFAEKQAMTKQADKSRRILKNALPISTKVMLLDNQRVSKSQPMYRGPYQVVYYDTRNNGYRLLGMDGALFPRSCPVETLKVISGALKLADVDTKDSTLAFAVEYLINHRHNPQTKEDEYLVKWKDYPESENSWLGSSHFLDTDCIRNYFLHKAGENQVSVKRSPVKQGVRKPVAITVKNSSLENRNKKLRTSKNSNKK